MLLEKIRKDDLDFDMTSVDSLRDQQLLPTLARLRAEAPVYWSETNRCWQITRYDDIAAAFQDVRFSNVRMSEFGFRSIPEADRPQQIPELMHYVKGWIVNVDGEAHKRLRSVSTRALNKRFVDSLRPLFESLSKEMTEKAARLKQCDYVAEIAYFLPATVILTLLGLPLRHLQKVREWNRAITSALSAPFAAAPTLIAADRAIAEMNSMLREEIARRRIEPKADLLGTMVGLSDDESNPLEVDDILGLCHLFLTAGHETTVNSLVFGLIAWYANPEQRELFLSGKVEPLLAIQEMLRYIGMSSAQPRVVGEDFEFRGQQLKKGDVVFLWVLSANNDPDKFPDPGQLDLTRPNVGEVMTFGPGLHHCIGHYIARLELMVFFQTFLPHFSKIEILDDPLALLPNLSFRGLDHLNVRFAE